MMNRPSFDGQLFLDLTTVYDDTDRRENFCFLVTPLSLSFLNCGVYALAHSTELIDLLQEEERNLNHETEMARLLLEEEKKRLEGQIRAWKGTDRQSLDRLSPSPTPTGFFDEVIGEGAGSNPKFWNHRRGGRHNRDSSIAERGFFSLVRERRIGGYMGV